MTSHAITVALVHFRTTTLDHLDAAWFSLSKQDDWTDVQSVVVYDNNTDDDPDAILEVLARYPIPVPVDVCGDKHGDPVRTHSYSVNRVCGLAGTPWVFFTRSDFLLDPTCLSRFRQVRDTHRAAAPDWQGFVTSWCHQMGCDDALSNTDVLAPHSYREAPWRHSPHGPRTLIGHVPACPFKDGDKDAGVWLTRTDLWEQSGGLNERLVSWGYQQQVWQRKLVSMGTQIVQIPEFLFHHQHHAAPRSVDVANRELRAAER